MRPINLGNTVAVAQWENENEFASFPFESHSEADGVVSDLSVFVSGTDAPMRLASVHVGPAMVSVSLSDGSNCLACTVSSSAFEPYRPYVMSSVSGSASGVCSFGDVDFSSPVFRKFGGSGPAVLETLVTRIDAGRLLEFVDDDSGESVSGDVEIRLPAGASCSRTDDGIEISMNESLDDLVVSPCDSKDGELRAGELSPIRSINGLSPDSSGRIAVVFS